MANYSVGEYSTMPDIPAAPSWDHLQVGDVIVNTDGDKAKILAVLGDVFLRSWGGRHDDVASEWFTTTEAQRSGWKLEGSEEAPEEIEANGVKYRKADA